jgi:hypothetical protein
MQQPNPLCKEGLGQQGYASYVAAGPTETCNKAIRDRIDSAFKHDGDRCGRGMSGQ